jgi:hypothetical protein
MKKMNKKTIVVGFAALVIAVGAAVNVGVFSKKDKLMSDLSLANVEALALATFPEEKIKDFLDESYRLAKEFMDESDCHGGGIDCGSITAELSETGYETMTITYYLNRM